VSDGTVRPTGASGEPEESRGEPRRAVKSGGGYYSEIPCSCRGPHEQESFSVPLERRQVCKYTETETGLS
jgi:hypothetical protein